MLCLSVTNQTNSTMTSWSLLDPSPLIGKKWQNSFLIDISKIPFSCKGSRSWWQHIQYFITLESSHSIFFFPYSWQTISAMEGKLWNIRKDEGVNRPFKKKFNRKGTVSILIQTQPLPPFCTMSLFLSFFKSQFLITFEVRVSIHFLFVLLVALWH